MTKRLGRGVFVLWERGILGRQTAAPSASTSADGEISPSWQSSPIIDAN
jgi:hypothetical protein